ncbi:MAG: hypothetical protein QF654_10240 [Alphaproteobacteria bacterium]|jgi:hypothetical protein|nr:hypothetical protein [Alphaproteobacteria bacterium]
MLKKDLLKKLKASAGNASKAGVKTIEDYRYEITDGIDNWLDFQDEKIDSWGAGLKLSQITRGQREITIYYGDLILPLTDSGDALFLEDTSFEAEKIAMLAIKEAIDNGDFDEAINRAVAEIARETAAVQNKQS